MSLGGSWELGLRMTVADDGSVQPALSIRWDPQHLPNPTGSVEGQPLPLPNPTGSVEGQPHHGNPDESEASQQISSQASSTATHNHSQQPEAATQLQPTQGVDKAKEGQGKGPHKVTPVSAKFLSYMYPTKRERWVQHRCTGADYDSQESDELSDEEGPDFW